MTEITKIISPHVESLLTTFLGGSIPNIALNRDHNNSTNPWKDYHEVTLKPDVWIKFESTPDMQRVSRDLYPNNAPLTCLEVLFMLSEKNWWPLVYGG